MTTRLTKLMLDAAIEALNERLAGEIESDIPLCSYRAALEKLQAQRAKRKSRKKPKVPFTRYIDACSGKLVEIPN